MNVDPASSIISEEGREHDYSSMKNGGQRREATPNQAPPQQMMAYQHARHVHQDQSLYTAVQKPTPSIGVSQADATNCD